MANLSLLSQAIVGEPLFLYLAVSNTAVSAALTREDGSVQRPVYYTSRDATKEMKKRKCSKSQNLEHFRFFIFFVASHHSSHIRVLSDSQLVVGQIIGEFDAKEDTMRDYRDLALPLVRLFNTFHIKHIPWAENSKADEMAQLASADQSSLNSDHPMDLHAIVLFLSACSHLVGHNGIEGDWRSLTKEEDLELEEQLKHLNKPAVKTIQMKPTSLPNRSRDQVSSKDSKPLHIGLKDGDCPVGTVPIRRTTKEDLIREKLASKIMTPADDTGGADYAIVETIVGPNKYSGASAVLSVHQPDVVGKQYSAGRMMIQNGPDSLQVGWRVDPSLFGDARQAHCFNTNCPGFVIVNTDIPLGSVIGKVSIRGGIPVEVEIYILQDLANGNWWLGVANTNVGFWPKRILDGGLANLASHAEWGGEVFSPPGTPKPAMGGGHFLIESTSYDAYFRSIALKSPSGGDINPQTYEFTSNRKLYDVKDEGNRGAYFGHVVLYGGPAGMYGTDENKEGSFTPMEYLSWLACMQDKIPAHDIGCFCCFGSRQGLIL
ncbi:unnamed protein product [Camellia sinensis]